MKLRSAILTVVASAAATACAAHDTNDTNDTNALTESTPEARGFERATEIFAAERDAAWTFRIDGRARKPVHVAGISATVVGEHVSPYAATLAFLTRFEDRFAIETPALHVREKRVTRDARGMTHLRLQQVERGVPVLGAEMMAHYDARGALRTLDSTYAYDLGEVNLEPKLTAAEALAIAEGDLKALTGVSTADVDAKPELVVHVPRGEDRGSPVLAYHLDLRSPDDPGIWMDYAIDARTGAIAKRYNKVMSLVGSGVGVGGDTKAIEVSQYKDRFALIDVSRTPNGIETYDDKNKGVDVAGMLLPGSGSLPGDLVVAPMKDGPWDQAAVDAHYFAGLTYDFYKTKFQRKGIDDADGKIISSVHVLKNWSNAQWAQFDGKQMLYGDGNGTSIVAMSGDLDIVAHELTHGVTFATSELTYVGESGALNEAVSDIFAVLVSHAYKPDPSGDWCLAGDVLVGDYAGKCVRSISHPENGLSRQPCHMSEFRNVTDDGVNNILDLGGVHTNSGIVNNAFYLMTVGGTNDTSKVEVESGIGWEKAAQLWYRTNVYYLSSNSGFRAAADANLSAAKDLSFTENQKNIIECAWIAVGVLEGECKAITPEATEPERDAGAAPVGSDDGTSDPTSGDGATNAGDGSGDEATSGDAKAEPESGCSMSKARRLEGSAAASGALALAAALWTTRRRRRKPV